MRSCSGRCGHSHASACSWLHGVQAFELGWPHSGIKSIFHRQRQGANCGVRKAVLRHWNKWFVSFVRQLSISLCFLDHHKNNPRPMVYYLEGNKAYSCSALHVIAVGAKASDSDWLAAKDIFDSQYPRLSSDSSQDEIKATLERNASPLVLFFALRVCAWILTVVCRNANPAPLSNRVRNQNDSVRAERPKRMSVEAARTALPKAADVEVVVVVAVVGGAEQRPEEVAEVANGRRLQLASPLIKTLIRLTSSHKASLRKAVQLVSRTIHLQPQPQTLHQSRLVLSLLLWFLQPLPPNQWSPFHLLAQPLHYLCPF